LRTKNNYELVKLRHINHSQVRENGSIIFWS